MQTLKINLENCYGIKKLVQTFDFSNFQTALIYSPNGLMKTSLAKTFKDISNGVKPCDQADLSLTSVFEVTSNTNSSINPNEICVIENYNEKAFESEDKILTLLADEKTRQNYFNIFNQIESLKKSTLSPLKKITGSSNYESEIIDAFSSLNNKNIYEIFISIKAEIHKSKNTYDFKYNAVFDKNNKVKKFIVENYALLEQYIEKYNILINKSKFFCNTSETIFGTTEAINLDKSLEGDEYFNAGHQLTLKNYGSVTDQKQFSKIINDEIAKVFDNPELKIVFEKIEKTLNANRELHEFKKVIEKNNSLILKLKNYEEFRKEVWIGFLSQIETSLETLIDLYKEKKVELEKIIQDAKEGQTAWDEAKKEFENRFINMPFSIAIKNKTDAILNADTPALEFIFKDKPIERTMLVDKILSQGEKRAFYLLNIIFEIKSRQLKKQKTLFIIDDIADSFDYKNKYAIIEYLNDLSKDPIFYSVILTHNFDFFRTIQSRILTESYKRTHSYIAEKREHEIKLIEAGDKSITNPFTHWQTDINDNEKHLLACIPFVRNLIEFKEGPKNTDFMVLTHVLHHKETDTENNIKQTQDIEIEDLENVFCNTLSGINFKFSNKNRKILDVLDSVIKEILNNQNSNNLNLEDKIILAIGSRLNSEKYMWAKVTNKSPISGSQTGKLFQRYKEEFLNDPNQKTALKILESVNIITPENIHLNSFMYEPLIDMGIDELKKLYVDSLGLT